MTAVIYAPLPASVDMSLAVEHFSAFVLILLENFTLCVLLLHSVFQLCLRMPYLTEMGKACRWISICELLDDEEFARGSLGNTHIVTSIHVPAIKPTNVFWSYKASLCIRDRHSPSLQRLDTPPPPPGCPFQSFSQDCLQLHVDLSRHDA